MNLNKARTSEVVRTSDTNVIFLFMPPET